MDYFGKYVKYKNKYIKLSNLLKQCGGAGKPSVSILKSINLFPKDTDINLFLNPVYGFIHSATSFINNRIDLYDDKVPVSVLVKVCFDITNIYRPLHKT